MSQGWRELGWNTYRQIVSELSPGQWPYNGIVDLVYDVRR